MIISANAEGNGESPEPDIEKRDRGASRHCSQTRHDTEYEKRETLRGESQESRSVEGSKEEGEREVISPAEEQTRDEFVFCEALLN